MKSRKNKFDLKPQDLYLRNPPTSVRGFLTNAVYLFIVIFTIIIVFYFFDKYFHSLSDGYSVPQRYFKNKIIYGVIIGYITAFFMQKKKLIWRSLIFSGVVSILLQVRYFIEGYSLNFAVLFLFIHFAILIATSLIIFYLFDKVKKNRRL